MRIGIPLTLALALTASIAAAQVITEFPDGSDSIGIPTQPYVSANFARCERVIGQRVRCDMNARAAGITSMTATANSVGNLKVPVDSAAQCRYDTAELPLPLPTTGGSWSPTSAGWCFLVQRTDTNAIVYPASHCEAYRYGLRWWGSDSECWYPDLPGDAPFVYLTAPPPASLARRAVSAVTFGAVRARSKGAGASLPAGALPVAGSRAAYRVRSESTED